MEYEILTEQPSKPIQLRKEQNNLEIIKNKLKQHRPSFDWTVQAHQIVEVLKNNKQHSGPFLQKVNKRDAPDYYDIIKEPMDLSLVQRKLKADQYLSVAEFRSDLELIWSNCLFYNSDPQSVYRQHALEMKSISDALVDSLAVEESSRQRAQSVLTEDDDMLSTEGSMQDLIVGLEESSLTRYENFSSAVPQSSTRSVQHRTPDGMSEFEYCQRPEVEAFFNSYPDVSVPCSVMDGNMADDIQLPKVYKLMRECQDLSAQVESKYGSVPYEPLQPVPDQVPGTLKNAVVLLCANQGFTSISGQCLQIMEDLMVQYIGKALWSVPSQLKLRSNNQLQQLEKIRDFLQAELKIEGQLKQAYHKEETIIQEDKYSLHEFDPITTTDGIIGLMQQFIQAKLSNGAVQEDNLQAKKRKSTKK